MDTPASFVAVIALWPEPSAATLAHDLGLAPLVVRQWRLRRRIPAHHWAHIESAATARGLAGITAALLARLGARRRGA